MHHEWKPPAWLDRGQAAGSHPVPIVSRSFPTTFDRRDWEARCTAWAASDRKNHDALGPYAELAEPCGRFVVLWRDQPGYGWPEARVALALQEDGFTCWTGVQLFPRAMRKVTSALLKRNTDQVEGLLRETRRPVPREFLARFDPSSLPLRNPDLVCFNKTSGEWRFIEAKGEKDRINKGQANALAFLHDLTGAHVEIQRLWPQGRDWRTHDPVVGSYRLTR